MVSHKDSSSPDVELPTIAASSTYTRNRFQRSVSNATYLYAEPATKRNRRIAFAIVFTAFVFMLVGLLYFYFSRKQAEATEIKLHKLNKTEARPSWWRTTDNGWAWAKNIKSNTSLSWSEKQYLSENVLVRQSILKFYSLFRCKQRV